MLKPKTALIILYCVLALLVVALIVQIAIEKEFNGEIALRTLVPMALCASGIAKISTGGGRRIRNSALYEKEYKHILRRAFAEKGRMNYRKRLIDALNYYNRSQYEKAIEICNSLLPNCDTDDDYCAVLTVQALALTDAGLPRAAIDLYYEILRHDNTFSTAWSNLGVLFKGQGKNLDAISCYENAVECDPQNATAYSNLANAYFSIGCYYLCIENAEKALERKANMVQAMTALCAAYTALGNEEKANEYFKRAVQNGYDADKLDNFIMRVRRGIVREDLVPLDEAQKKGIWEVYASTSAPLIRVCLPAENCVKSRLGGRPLGEAPLNERGERMKLLFLLFCAEVRGIENFPQKGILQFFISDDENYGLDREDPTSQKNFRVVYTEEDSIEESQEDVSETSAHFPIQNSAGLIFMPDMCAMSDSDYRFEDTVKNCFEKHGAELSDGAMREAKYRYHLEGHKIGGYPYFVKIDPRAVHPEYQKYDTLLLQIDTHDGFIEVGNEGVMNFFISGEHLKNKDFSDILYWWDERTAE